MFLDRAGIRKVIALVVAGPLLASVVAVALLAQTARSDAQDYDSRIERVQAFTLLRLIQSNFEVEWHYYDSLLAAENFIETDAEQSTQDFIDSVAAPVVREGFDLAVQEVGEKGIATRYQGFVTETEQLIGEARVVYEAKDRDAWNALLSRIHDVSQRMDKVITAELAEGDPGWQRLYDQSLHGESTVLEVYALVSLGRHPSPIDSDLYISTIAAGHETDRTFELIVLSANDNLAAELSAQRKAAGLIEFREMVTDPHRSEPIPLSELVRILPGFVEYASLIADVSLREYDEIVAGPKAERAEAMTRFWILVGTGIGVVVLSAAGGLIVGRRISGRIERLADGARLMSSGYYEMPKPSAAADDEIAVLGRSLYELSRTVSVAQHQIVALSHGAYSDPIFDRELPGAIGADLQEALRELTASAEQLHHQSRHDPLTGLLSRRGLNEDFAAIGGTVVLAMVDLDGFKQVNDDHGHAMGDEVLRRVASGLRREMHDGDIVARTGGDEFVIVLVAKAKHVVEEQLQRIIPTIEMAARSCVPSHRVSASVGWCVVRLPAPLNEALARADAAMYTAKRCGKRQLVRAAG